jgi:hypothetical protein
MKLNPRSSSDRHSHVVAVGTEKMNGIAVDYSKAISASIETAIHGIALADDGVGLCDYLSRHPRTDIRSFIEEMRQIAHKANTHAKETCERFGYVRRAMLQVCN